MIFVAGVLNITNLNMYGTSQFGSASGTINLLSKGSSTIVSSNS